MTNPSPTPNQDELVKHMVDRFLGWKLPEDFEPDSGITFNRYVNGNERKPDWWPVGTNLLTATQAEAMVRHMLGDELESFIDRTVEERLTKHLDNIEASIKQHTVPEGVGLVTRSYVINAIEFERTAAQQQKGTEK